MRSPCVLVGHGVSLAAGLMLAACEPAASRTASPEPALAAFPSCNEAWARKTIEVVYGTPLVRGRDFSDPSGAVVLVREGPWQVLDFEQQQVLAAAFDCAVAGNGSHLRKLSFRLEREGPNLVSFDAPALRRLRQAGYGDGPDGWEALPSGNDSEQPARGAVIDRDAVVLAEDFDFKPYCRAAVEIAQQDFAEMANGVDTMGPTGQPDVFPLAPYVKSRHMPAEVSCPVIADIGEGGVNMVVRCLAPIDRTCVDVPSVDLKAKIYFPTVDR